MVAEQLGCGVDEAFRVLQIQGGEDPLGLERVSWWILACHVLLVEYSSHRVDAVQSLA